MQKRPLTYPGDLGERCISIVIHVNGCPHILSFLLCWKYFDHPLTHYCPNLVSLSVRTPPTQALECSWVPLGNPWQCAGVFQKHFVTKRCWYFKLTFFSLCVGQPLIHFLPVHRHLDQVCCLQIRGGRWERNWSVKGRTPSTTHWPWPILPILPFYTTQPSTVHEMSKMILSKYIKNCHLTTAETTTIP